MRGESDLAPLLEIDIVRLTLPDGAFFIHSSLVLEVEVFSFEPPALL